MDTMFEVPPHGRFAKPDVRVETNPKWIRGFVGDQLVVDSTDTLFVWEVPYYPQWYFPRDAFSVELRRNGRTHSTDSMGDAALFDLVLADGDGGRVLADAAWIFEDSPVEAIRDRVRVDFPALDRWMEEEVEAIVHPRSPYARVDILPTSRRVQISVHGVVVASTERASILFETGLPPRYYFPIDDVVDGVLSDSDASSACPYKGVARYWDVTVGDSIHRDLVWGYDDPLPESAAVKDLVCFYNEKVEIEIDGQAVKPQHSKFS